MWTLSDVQGTGVVGGRATHVDMHCQRCSAQVWSEGGPTHVDVHRQMCTAQRWSEGGPTHVDMHRQRSEAQGWLEGGLPIFLFTHEVLL